MSGGIPLSVGFAWPPAWLIGLIRGDMDPPATRSASTNGNGRGPSDDAGAFWLGKALDQAAPGNRNATGFWLACQLRDAGLSETAAEAVMLGYAAQRASRQRSLHRPGSPGQHCGKPLQASPRDPAQRLGATPQPTRKPPASSAPRPMNPRPGWERAQPRRTRTPTHGNGRRTAGLHTRRAPDRPGQRAALGCPAWAGTALLSSLG